MYRYLKEHVGAFGPHEIRHWSPHWTRRGNPFRPVELSLLRMRMRRLHGRFLRNILLRPLSKASLTSVACATALSWPGLNQICGKPLRRIDNRVRYREGTHCLRQCDAGTPAVAHGDTRWFALNCEVKLSATAGGTSGGHGSAPWLSIWAEV